MRAAENIQKHKTGAAWKPDVRFFRDDPTWKDNYSLLTPDPFHSVLNIPDPQELRELLDPGKDGMAKTN